MAAQKKSGLGRGLDALFSSSLMDENESVKTVPIASIVPNPRQPRTRFKEEELTELADSIREHGVIQPLVVSEQEDGTYTLIAGERRLRASQVKDVCAPRSLPGWTASRWSPVRLTIRNYWNWL